MTQISFKNDTLPSIFAAVVLTAIYINLKILMNQTFFQIFEGELGLTVNTIVVFVVILLSLIVIQYLIHRKTKDKAVNE